MQNIVISSTAIVLYLTTAGLLATRFFGKGSKSEGLMLLAKPGVLTLGLVAVAFHAIALYQGLFSISGLNLGFFNAISLISFLISLLILLAAISNPVENLGIFLLPMAALAILLGIIFPVEHTISTSTALDLKIHILVSIMASSLLGIAAVHAIVLAVQDRHLRNKKPGGYIRSLPPLQTMETLLFQMIGLGFFLHSLSLITGIIYLEDMFAQHVAHKTVLSIIAWFVFAILLWGRWRFGWRGTTAIRWTLGGFITLLLAYLGSKWVLEIILDRV